MDGSGSNGSVVPLARFAYRLAPEDVSDALTGFEHNAVTPFGLRTAGIPVCVRLYVRSLAGRGPCPAYPHE